MLRFCVRISVFTSIVISFLLGRVEAGAQSAAAETSGPAILPQMLQELPNTVLRDGTPVRLRITRTLSTATAKVGDLVEFQVVQDVKVGDLVVIPHGAIAWGTVSKVQPKRRPSRNADLGVEMKAARAVTDQEIALRGNRTVKGDVKPNQAISDSGPLWPILPLVLKGDDAFISKGGKVDAYVNGDATFDSTVLQQSVASLETKNAAALAAATAGKAEVHIYRHVPDVVGGKPDIYLDGAELARMQGDRYFNIILNPGKHIFRADESEISVECKAGEEYYLRVERQGSFLPKAHLFLMPNLQGEDETYPLEPANPKDIVNRTYLAVPHIDH